MITRQVQVSANPKEVAEMLFDLDNEQVAQVFHHWKKLFDDEYQRRKDANEPIWIFDLNHFFLYVVDHLDDDGKDIIRSMYSSMIYRMCDNIHKKHLLDLHL